MKRIAISFLPIDFRSIYFGARIRPSSGLSRFLFFIFNISAFIFFILSPPLALSQTAPQIEWEQTYGGPKIDEGFAIIQNDTGGYTIGGYTHGGEDDYIYNYHGYEDGWVISLNDAGQNEWNECYGGSLDEEINGMVQTRDGGHCCAIRTESDDGEVLNSNDGPSDAWIVKLSPTGNIEWQNDLGGSNFNDPISIVQSADGGFVFAGYTLSTDGDVTGHHGTGENADAWVVKLDSSGNMLWGKCYGGSERDWAESIVQTPDGGYCFAGFSNSIDGDVTGFKGGASDEWVVKLDSVGNIQWEKCLGGDSEDFATNIKNTSDGGFIVAGETFSNDSGVSGNHGGGDELITKLTANGDIEWQKCFGGSGEEKPWCVVQATDGGYFVVGTSTSNDGDVSGNHGGGDAWVVKLDAVGNLQWQRCCGGSGMDFAYSVIQTKDGGYAFTGSTASDDGDVIRNDDSPQDQGALDVWVVKFGNPASVNSAEPIPSTQNGLSLTAQLHSSIANLGVSLPTAPSILRVDVTNILGMRAEEIEEKSSQTGYQNFPLDFTQLIAGTYFITVSACGLTQTIPVSVVK